MRRLKCSAAIVATAAMLQVFIGGCTRRPAWNEDPTAGTLSYWAERPASVRVTASDYAALWNAADEARRRFGFDAALTDYRGGLLTTTPTVSPQFFEFWRDELRTAGDAAESSLATVRRRLRFEFAATEDGAFVVEPKVLVERLALAERRITNAIDYRGTLGPGRQQRVGPGESDRRQPGRYWYATGRDADLEHALARRIARRVGGVVSRPPSAAASRPTVAAASR